MLIIFVIRLQLNDVERGGSTAFPRAGVAVKPTKKGAAFWFNLKRSGKPDPLTLHGACPVLLGHKWGELLSLFLGYLVFCMFLFICLHTIYRLCFCFSFNNFFLLIIKTVSNKWIRETAQTFNRRCLLDANQ